MKLTMLDFKGLPFMLRFVFLSYVFTKVLKKENMICLCLFENFGRIMVGLCLPSYTPFLILYLTCDRDNNGEYIHFQSQRTGKMAP